MSGGRREAARGWRREAETWCGVSDDGTSCKMALRLERTRDLFTVQDAKMGIGHDFGWR
jgi:hypothetical protein